MGTIWPRIEGFFSKGWVNLLIGLLVSWWLFLRGRTTPRLAFQSRGVSLVSTHVASDLEVRFRGVVVDHLSKTTIVVWNDGTTTLRGEDIVMTDPLCLRWEEGTRILGVEMVDVTRATIAFRPHTDASFGNQLLILFDFLDPGDGARIEVYSTSRQLLPHGHGTIKGLPKGWSDYGIFPNQRKRSGPPRTIDDIVQLFAKSKVFLGAIVVIGVALMFNERLTDLLDSSFLKPYLDSGRANPEPPIWVIPLLGFVNAAYSGLLLWSLRRRVPDRLADK